jgi:hypothetical protein
MKAIEAFKELKSGKCITSSYHYGHFKMLSDNTIYYFCNDSGCDFCKSKYTKEEFFLLDCEFEILK